MATTDTKSKQVYLSTPRIPPKVYLETINEQITCTLCKGYLIDATTIVECLHSYCRSCIIKHLRDTPHQHPQCPFEGFVVSDGTCREVRCAVVINKAKPNIKPDTTLQAIVYKLVPGLYERELLRRRAFYRLRKEEAQQATPEQRGDDTEHLIFGPNENISLMLEYSDNDSSYRSSDDENNSDSGCSQLKSTNHNSDDEIDSQLSVPKYLQCPAIFRISNLKKFVMHKFGIDPNKFCVEIMYKVKTISLPDYYTLMDVAYIYTWKRDAPMKFFYCVRAATKENVALPNVDNLMQPSAEYTNAKNAYLDALRIRDTDHEQSSDADSDMPSESGVSVSALCATSSATTIVNATVTHTVNGNACSAKKTETEISTTSPAVASTTTASIRNTVTTTTTTTTMPTTMATSMATSMATTTILTSTPISNGNQTNRSISQTPRLRTPPLNSAEEKSDRATERPAATNSETVERLSATPNHNKGPKDASEQPTKINGNDKSLDALSNSPSSSRSNFEVEMTKEKVKIKIVSTKSETNNLKIVASTESDGQPLNNSPAAASSPPTTSGLKTTDSIEPAAPAKSKFLLNKDKDVMAKSASNPEAEYDFDQHLLEEKLSEKNEFLNAFNLAPRTAAEMQAQANQTSSKNEPKNDQPTDLSKDVKSSTAASVSSSLAPTTKNAPPSSSSSSSSSSPPTAARTSSPHTQTLIDVDKDPLRRPENKASKRKSREPVKNITRVKCPPPTSSGTNSNWIQSVAASINGGGKSQLSLLPSSSTNLYKSDRLLTDAMTSKAALDMQQIDQWSEQHKNNLNKSLVKFQQQHHHQHQRPATFKVPIVSESFSSSTGIGAAKDSKKSAESETSIIINNVQRPNQADTPRPSMAYYLQPNHQLFSETEIKEIRNDDAMKLKVYGPAMSSYESPIPNALRDELLKKQHMKNVAGSMYIQKRNYNLSNQNEPLQMNAPAFLPYPKSHNIPESSKKIKLKSGNSSPGPIDMKKRLNSTGELEVISSSKVNETPKRQIEPSTDEQHVHTLLNSCNITLPASLSVTLTNDEIESNRSLFNQKKTPVNNSIEIVKLPDESLSPNDSTRYTKAQSNSPNILGRSEHNHSGSSSPVAINLVNNSPSTSSHSPNATKQTSDSNPVPGTSNSTIIEGFQAKFEESVAKKVPPTPSIKLKTKKIFKPNPMLTQSSLSYNSMLSIRSPPKRKPTLNGPKIQMQLPNKRLQRSPARKLMAPKIDSSLMASPSMTEILANIRAEQLKSHINKNMLDIQRLATAKAEPSSMEAQLFASHRAKEQISFSAGGSNSGSSMSSSNKAKYLSIPTSPKPIWMDYSTQSQHASHMRLTDLLKKN